MPGPQRTRRSPSGPLLDPRFYAFNLNPETVTVATPVPIAFLDLPRNVALELKAELVAQRTDAVGNVFTGNGRAVVNRSTAGLVAILAAVFANIDVPGLGWSIDVVVARRDPNGDIVPDVAGDGVAVRLIAAGLVPPMIARATAVLIALELQPAIPT